MAFLAISIGVVMVAAPPAHAAGTWANPGAWTFANVDGSLILNGKGKDPGLLAATSLRECNNGTNDDANAAATGTPVDFQDLSADFGSTPTDSQCTSIDDTSEIQGGLQAPAVLRVNANVAAGGAVTVATPGTNVVFPTVYQYINLNNVPTLNNINTTVVVGITATAASGNLDPATGVGTINLTLTLNLYVDLGSGTLGATCNPAIVNIAGTTGTSGSLTGTAYNPATGLLTIVDNTFTVPTITGSTTGFLGLNNLGAPQLCPQIGAGIGGGQPGGKSSLRLQLRVLPTAGSIPQPTVTGVTGTGVTGPTTVTATEGQALALTPVATDPNTSLATAAPPTPNPSYNWRWTQTGGPGTEALADETHITSPIVAGDRGILNTVDKVTGQAKFVVPKAGVYTFRVEAGNGGATTYGTPQTITVNATAVNPTVNAGPDITASGGQSAVNNPVKLTQTTTSPAPADANPASRTYTWTKAGTSTCAPADLTFTTPAAQNTTFSTGAVGADCFVDAVATTTVNGKNGSDTVRVFVKATTAGQIKGTVTACTASCAPLASGTVFAFTRTAVGPPPNNTPTYSTPILQGTVTGGTYTIPGATPGTPYGLWFTGPGVSSAWFGGVTTSGATKAVFAPYAGADVTLYGGASGNGNLDATVNVPTGPAPGGTPVRLYDMAGRYVAKAVTGNTPTVNGVAHFTGLPTGSYKVNFAPGSATYNQRWADSGLNVSTAQGQAVVSGGATKVVTTTLTLMNPTAADYQFDYDGGVPSASSTTVITDSSKNWTNSWVGSKLFVYGTRSQTVGANTQIRTITGSNANSVTVPALTFAPPPGISNYQILPAKFLGVATSGTTTTIADTGQAWAAPNGLAGYELRTIFGTGTGQSAIIQSNTATTITLASTLATAPDNTTGYLIVPLKANLPGVLGGLTSSGRTGGPLATNVNTEARVYDATNGSFVGKVGLTGAAQPLGSFSTFNFLKWTADPAAPNGQNGLPSGSYKVLVRIIGTGGGTPSFCSRWAPKFYTNTSGGPAQGSFANAASFAVNAGSYTDVGSMPIIQDAACQATN